MENVLPIVSIIVPIYNGEKTLSRCVKSIMERKFTEYELLLINDGSTDRSLEICHELEKSDKRIRVMDKANEGVSATRNFGIKEARGKYIQFVDCDDYVAKDYLDCLVKALEKEQADLVIAGYTRHKNGKVTKRVPQPLTFENLNAFSKEFFNLYNQWFLNTPWNKLYRKEKIVDKFPLNMSLGEDLLFNLHYLKYCEKITVIDHAGYQYCIENENSLAIQYRKDKFENSMLLHEKVLAFSKEVLGLNEEEQWNDITFLKEIRFSMKHLVRSSTVSKKEKKEQIKAWLQTKEVKDAYGRCKQLSKPDRLLKVLIEQEWVEFIYILLSIL